MTPHTRHSMRKLSGSRNSKLQDDPEVVLDGGGLVLKVQLLTRTRSELLQRLNEASILTANPGPHRVPHLVGGHVGVDGHAAGGQFLQHLLVRHPGLASSRVASVQPEHV